MSRKYQGFTTFYNVLFNGEEALATELQQREKSHQDNFHAPFITILTYEDLPAEKEMQEVGLGNGPLGTATGPFRNGPQLMPQNSASSVGALKIAEIKAEKAIEKHSMMFNGQERNKPLFEAYLLLAKARLYQNKTLEALDALNKAQKVFGKDKRMPLIKVYEAHAIGKLKDYYRSEEAFRSLKESKLKKPYRKLLSIFYSEMLLSAGKREEAIEELEEAFVLNKNKKLRSRIAFLRGQILASLGKNEEARASFVTAYKNARNFELEVKSQVEMAKTFSGTTSAYEDAKKYLENISKKGTFASRRNELYYALGMMALNNSQKEEAVAYFKKSTQEKMSDPQLRGQVYYEMGKKYFAENDYLKAGAFFDSAYAAMNYPPAKQKVGRLTKNIKDFSKNYYLILKNDSILKLVQMPEAEKRAFFLEHIAQIKKKEEKEELLRKKERSDQNMPETSFSLLKNSDNNTFFDFGQSKGFYFSNPSTVAKGEAAFKQTWGNRALTDNWRTSTRKAVLEDLKSDAMGITKAADPRRLEPEFYLEQLPQKQEDILALKKARDSASLGLGRMYESYFGNAPLATKTWYDLVDAGTDTETELQALYLIFSLNFEKTPQASERAKQLILEKHPYTSYAEFVKNPQKKNLTQTNAEVELAYQEAFSLYSKEKFEESNKAIETALQKYPQDLLVPKFLLLKALNTGKTQGKEVMILQLEQLMLNYNQTPEGKRAAKILSSIKSDLKVEQFDAKGSPIPQNISSEAKKEMPPVPQGNLRLQKELLQNLPEKKDAVKK